MRKLNPRFGLIAIALITVGLSACDSSLPAEAVSHVNPHNAAINAVVSTIIENQSSINGSVTDIDQVIGLLDTEALQAIEVSNSAFKYFGKTELLPSNDLIEYVSLCGPLGSDEFKMCLERIELETMTVDPINDIDLYFISMTKGVNILVKNGIVVDDFHDTTAESAIKIEPLSIDHFDDDDGPVSYTDLWTAGGYMGSLFGGMGLGATFGAGAGSVVPSLGTGAGGLVGGILGGVGGHYGYSAAVYHEWKMKAGSWCSKQYSKFEQDQDEMYVSLCAGPRAILERWEQHGLVRDANPA